MGTRAAFYLGNPCDGGRLLGCIAFDGYPDGEVREMVGCLNEPSFLSEVSSLAERRDDWTPAEKGFPFPWPDDVFVTDFTYAFFGGCVRATCFHSGWAPLSEWLKERSGDEDEAFHQRLSELPETPCGVERSKPGEGKDSIIIVSAP